MIIGKRQSGNIFLALFGAVALAALLSYAVSQFIRGPLTTSTNLTRSNTAKQQMTVAAQLVLATSATQTAGAGNGDCDSDNFIEPLEYRDGTTVPHPTGGGYLPSTVGATKLDPWGTEYGYCVWDAGSVITSDNNATCGGNTAKRLNGAKTTVAHPNKPNTQAIIAVISAGKDKAFQTTCNAFVDVDDNAEPDVILVDKTVGSDDIIVQYTYNEARDAGGDLWYLKSADPSTATIGKNVEIAAGQSLDFGLGSRLLLPTDSELTNADCTGTSATQVNAGALRLNMTATPPSLQVCYDSDATAAYHWAWGSSSGGSVGSIDDLTDGVADYATLFNVFLGDIAGASAATGTYNTATGYQSMQGIRFGSRNTAYGASALSSNQDQDDNSAFGNSALFTLSDSGSGGNSAFGAGAAYALYDGGQTSAFGKDALYSNSSGVGNSAFGNRALYSATSGDGNTAIGVNATQSSTYVSGSVSVGSQAASNAVSDGSFVVIGADAFSGGRGSGVVAIGYQSMFYRAGAFASSAQTYNTAVGYQSLYGSSTVASNTGTSNVAIGHSVMRSTTSGTGNVAIGAQTATVNAPLYANTTGSSNVAIGQGALTTNVAGDKSTAIGFEAMRYANSTSSSTDTNNVAVGYQALRGSGTASSNTGANNVAIGPYALVANQGGNQNMAIGTKSLYSNTSGSNNIAIGTYGTAVGYGTLVSNTTGSRNLAIGGFALRNNSTASENMALGYATMDSNTIGSQNVALGHYSLGSNNAGSQSTAVGHEAMYHANSSSTAFNTYNTAVGYQALYGSATASANTGTYNTALGHSAMRSATSGSENTAVGVSALYTNDAGQYNTAIGRAALSTTTGSNNTALGKSAGSNITTGSSNIMIGSGASAPSATASNQLNIGNSLYGDVSVHQLNLGSSTLVSGISLDVGSKTDSIRPAVGTTAQQPTCDSTRIGAMRFDTTVGSMMVCTTNGWQPLLMTSGGGGTTSTPPAGTGYFVLSYGTWAGSSLSGLAGANSNCLSDLKTYNWKNKSDAVSRGLLDSTHVEALLCGMRSGICQLPIASTTYTFAASGYTSTGGASFTTDASRLGPGNSQDWSGSNYFGSGAAYWTGFLANTATSWGSTVTGNSNDTCSGAATDWTNTAANGVLGASASTTGTRWRNTAPVCASGTLNHLVCMVHPGNESSVTNGYFVMTDTTYDGDLGGRSGADAKCLTELTTNTNWMGYTTANAAGRLIASKVRAFLCENPTCTSTNANTTYAFAIVGDSNVGGATFTTDVSGYGPNDYINWSGPSYFGGAYEYWMNRSSSGGSAFGNTMQHSSMSCNNTWSSNSAAFTGGFGISTTTTSSRWHSTTATCDVQKRLICLVNP